MSNISQNLETVASTKEFTILVDFTKSIYRITLSDIIEDDSYLYHDLIMMLKYNIPSHAKVFFHLQNEGGALPTATKIINAMNTCPARITCIAEGPVCSCATFIFLAGDVLIFEPNSYLMFHNFIYGTKGKGKELLDEIKHEWDINVKMYYKYLKPFLTDKEIKHLLKDKDIYLDWDAKDLPIRIKRHREDRSWALNLLHINMQKISGIDSQTAGTKEIDKVSSKRGPQL